MAKYRKIPVEIEAVQWWQNGDHPEDDCYYVDDKSSHRYLSEGKIVRHYRDPNDNGMRKCDKCGFTMFKHGWIDTLEGGHIVCPGDYIIKGIQGEYYPCKPDIFEKTYEKIKYKKR